MSTQLSPEDALSHNLLGQRLGKKGRDTRARILNATAQLLAGPRDTQISLSAVAREASLGMTTLYLYFQDQTELLLAVLDPILADTHEAYLLQMMTRWPEKELGRHCLEFVQAYQKFWTLHGRILHIRNSEADAGDERMLRHRVNSSEPVLTLLVRQMDGEAQQLNPMAVGLAKVCLSAIERLVMVTTSELFPFLAYEPRRDNNLQVLIEAQARMLELAIRDQRSEIRR